MSPLKVLIFGVPRCKPDARVVISCPISEPDGAGCGTCSGGPEGTPPPPNSLGSGDGVGCLNGPHLPPEKVTSWSSSLGFLLPSEHTHIFWRGTAGGHIYSALHNFLCKIFHKLSQLVVSKVSKFCLKMIWHPPAWGSLLGRCMQLSLPI